MILKINATGIDPIIKDVDCSESEVWSEVGKAIIDCACPGEIYVDLDGKKALLSVKARGSICNKDGKRIPSKYVVPDYNNIVLTKETYKEAYLTCINPLSNNYKFYHLIPEVSGIQAEYGRIGTSQGEQFGARRLQKPYESYQYWIRYYEKLSKGYTDQTDIYLNKPKPTAKDSKVKAETTSASVILFEFLQQFSKGYVAEKMIDINITYSQVKKARKLWNKLCQRKTVDGFNKVLLELMTLSPRKVGKVIDFIAKSKNDFESIIYSEEKLLLAMEGSIMPEKTFRDSPALNSFDGFNIEVYEANKKQVKEVYEHLPVNLQKKVKKIYRVIPKKQQEKFDKYVKENGIHRTKQFWHGSSNENWLSIVLNGLSLHPNAKVCGKMLGNGIYFAPSPSKSWGYTSAYGSRWSNGDSNIAIMGLYATAYGNPKIIGATDKIKQFNKTELETSHQNCVHVLQGAEGWIKSDEICYFSESAMVLNYLVEFSA